MREGERHLLTAPRCSRSSGERDTTRFFKAWGRMLPREQFNPLDLERILA